MQNKPLLYGLIGFFIGGFIVSVAATTFDKSGDTMSEMTAELRDKTGDDYDKAFLSYMIEHHRAAVDMAELSAQNAKHDEIKQLSQDITAIQEAEIHQMQQMQKSWGYGTTTDQSHDNH